MAIKEKKGQVMPIPLKPQQSADTRKYFGNLDCQALAKNYRFSAWNFLVLFAKNLLQIASPFLPRILVNSLPTIYQQYIGDYMVNSLVKYVGK